MMKLKPNHPLFYFFVVLMALVFVAFFNSSLASVAKDQRVIKVKDGITTKIHLAVGRTTVLSFSSRPSKVLSGSHGLFSIQYIDKDLALAPLTLSAKSNLFVYVAGQRILFELISGPSTASDTLVIVKTSQEEIMRVKVNE